MKDSAQPTSRRGLLQSAAVVSTCTAVSRLLGLVREALMAVFFGTELAKSAFDVAFKIPNLFRRLFGEGALSAAFIPILSETLVKEGKDEANRLASRVMTMLGTALLVIVLGGVVALTVALRYDLGSKMAAILPLLRIMIPYVFFICLVALCMAILNSYHHFSVPAATPAVLNVVWIVVIVVLCPRFGDTPEARIYGVAWGILLAGLIQLAIQLPILWRFGFRPRISGGWKDPRVKRVLLLMMPAAVGMGIHQVNVVVDSILAMLVSDRAPAVLTYSERLIYLPLGVFATALGTVLLPTFSRQAARDQQSQLRETLSVSARHLMLVMVPSAVGLAVLAQPIVQLVYVWRGGEFGELSTELTTRALWFYAPGLVMFSFYKLLVPAFYALKDTRTPVRIGLHVVTMNFALNVLFILTWPEGYKHAGIACATVLASAMNCIVLALILRRRIGPLGGIRIGISFLRTSVAAGIMGVTVWHVHQLLVREVIPRVTDVKVGHLLGAVGSVVAGMAVYSVVASILCRKEFKEIRAAFVRRQQRKVR